MFKVITAIPLSFLLVSFAGVLGQNIKCHRLKQYLRVRVDSIVSESTIATHKTKFHSECLFHCAQTPGCLSYNYQYSGNGEHLCELNNITLEACPAKLKPKEGYFYYVELNDTALQTYGSRENPGRSCLDIKQCQREGKDGEYWIIHEAKPTLVYCFMNTSDKYLPNLAKSKSTTQISKYYKANSSNAVDGNRNSDYSNGSCTTTTNMSSPWWRVDMEKKYFVRKVIITNRGNCCPERLSNFEIRIGSSLDDNGNANPACGGKYSLQDGETRSIVCDPSLLGRYVNIIIPDQTQLLHLCEVEVYP